MPKDISKRRKGASARIWILAAILAPLGMLAVSGTMLVDLRKDANDKAEQTSRNLLQIIERDIARNVEIIDLSLVALSENLHAPGVQSVAPDLRQLILFDRSTTAKDLGVMLAMDANGDILADSGAFPPRKANYADRAYFQTHRATPDLGLHIGAPIVSRLTGERMVPFSRRVNRPDGSFGGIVLGTLKLTYFSRLFDRLGLGREGAINLYLVDGTRVARHPFQDSDIGANIAGSENFKRFVREGSGAFTATSVRDGVERQYAFMQVGDLPLVLNVAQSKAEIEAEWRSKALVLGGTVLALCAIAVALSLLFGREIRRRTAVEAELARLSRTDALTGLPNRRRFDEAFCGSFGTSRRTGRPSSLLIVDADHFKRYNDRYGHAVGDAVLKAIARALCGGVHRPEDLVCRVGGEEFALLLPDTDEAGAMRIAGNVHRSMAGVAVPSAGIAPGSVTVSIGLACTATCAGAATPDALYEFADAALYAAKANGRNRTESAGAMGPDAKTAVGKAA
jgi:diguanylate cyclase (GGDEF)-like protein